MSFSTSLVSIGLCAWMAVPQAAPQVATQVAPIPAAEFERLMKELVPHGAEPWETIPWRSDLLSARDEAIRSGRPLFLWAMNGHPLGCT